MKTMVDQELITIASFTDYIQANVAKTKIESEGIDCWLADDIIVTLNWFYSRVYGGVKLKVRGSDVDSAKSALEDTVDIGPSEQRLIFGKIPRKIIFQIWAAYYVIPVALQLAYGLFVLVPELFNGR